MTTHQVKEAAARLANGERIVGVCPSCGGVVNVVPAVVSETYAPGFHCADRDLPRTERDCIVAACSSCEFCLEVK